MKDNNCQFVLEKDNTRDTVDMCKPGRQTEKATPLLLLPQLTLNSTQSMTKTAGSHSKQ